MSFSGSLARTVLSELWISMALVSYIPYSLHLHKRKSSSEDTNAQHTVSIASQHRLNPFVFPRNISQVVSIYNFFVHIWSKISKNADWIF